MYESKINTIFNNITINFFLAFNNFTILLCIKGFFHLVTLFGGQIFFNFFSFQKLHNTTLNQRFLRFSNIIWGANFLFCNNKKIFHRSLANFWTIQVKKISWRTQEPPRNKLPTFAYISNV